MPVWNTGFVVATMLTWDKFFHHCLPILEQSRVFLNAARVQWAMCYTLEACGYSHVLLPQHIHAHGHHGKPAGVTVENGVASFNGRPIAFRHRL